jgi:hypothetical protein
MYTTVLISPLVLFFFLGLNGTESIITGATTRLLYQPQMMNDDDECAAIGEILGSGNRSTRSNLAPVPLCLP